MSEEPPRSDSNDSSASCARLAALLARSRELIAEAQQKCRELDQLRAARKDARAKVRKGSEQMDSAAQDGLESLVQKRLSAPAPVAPAISDADRSHLLILVDDDEDDLALFQRALRKAGVTDTVRSAGEGIEAIDMLAHLGPEVARVCLVSDSRLPDMTGLELLRKVRTMVLPIPVKFAFLTGDTQPSTERRAQADGADAFYAKTSSTADLIGIASAIARL